MISKKQFKNLIKSNIDQYGYHITIVTSGNLPRYAYTIGLRDILDFELVFAGGIYYKKNELNSIFDSVIAKIRYNDDLKEFSIAKVESSWSEMMMLGVFDYYALDHINAYQIRPSEEYFTLDIPNMSKKWDINSEPIWKWLRKEWTYKIPKDMTVVTNLDALKGDTITEVMRWEADEWEIFSGAGPDVEEKDIRVVPLSVLLGIDQSLEAALNLEIKKGMWRNDGNSEWMDWG